MLVKLTPNQNFVIPFVDIGRKENSQELNKLKRNIFFYNFLTNFPIAKIFMKVDFVNIEGDEVQKFKDRGRP